MSANDNISRRTFVRGMAFAAASAPLASLLAACNTQDQGTASTSTDSPNSSANTNEQTSTPPTGSKILVAYFSGTGNTRRAAEAIASKLQADIFEIVPENPYTADDLNYRDDSSRVIREHEDTSLQDIALTAATPNGFDGYQTVFFGYPIWWQQAAWPVTHFASDNDFSGKTVIPFCTSTSSPLGNSATDLSALTNTGSWQEGMRFSSGVTASEVSDWADSLGLDA